MNMNSPAVWVVDDDASIRWVVEKTLARAGMQVRQFTDAESCLRALAAAQPNVLVTDLRMPGRDGHALLERLQQNDAPPPVIVISAHSDIDTVMRVYAGGAVELLAKPFDVEALLALVLRLVGERTATITAATTQPRVRIVGNSPAMQTVFRTIGRLSRTSMTVLITGESGTGKELIARALHDHSPRASRPFVAINTAAIPGELLESELFGHERGAFTGAHQRRTGRFEQADGGTLFLDEIGDMPLDMQTRLLRVLSENEFFRVGGHESVRTNVRVIAATHQDLVSLVAEGQFREDLFHRLNVVGLRVPPLRERPEDIPALLDHFLADAANELGVEPKHLDAGAAKRLNAHRWPGNVRELRNLCRRLTALAPGRQITRQDLHDEFEIPSRNTAGIGQWLENHFANGENGIALNAIGELERMLIDKALRECDGHRQAAARRLGWGRNTLARKIKEYGLDQR